MIFPPVGEGEGAALHCPADKTTSMTSLVVKAIPLLTVSLGTACIQVGGANPPHVSHDCSVTSEDESRDLLLEPTPSSEPA